MIKNPGDVHLREHFCHLRKEASRLSRRLKNDFFRRQCAEHSKEPKKLWQHINKVTGRLKHHHLPQCELTELTSYFALIVEDPNRPDDLSKDRQKTANSSDTGNRAPCLDEFSPVTSETVEKHLRSIDTSKASGSDGISGLLLKRGAAVHVLAPSLTRINSFIVTGTVSHLFKKATITPIHKSGDKSQAGNYRPISLLPIVRSWRKLSPHSLEYLNEHNFLPSEQCAYRQGHSAEDAVTLVVNNVLLARDANLCTGLAFVDLSKEFDRVQHQQLVNILAGVGVKGTALDWFVSYLSDRRQQVKRGISLGEVKVCSRGSPQA